MSDWNRRGEDRSFADRAPPAPEQGGYSGESFGGPDFMPQTPGGRDFRGRPFPETRRAEAADGREGFDRYGVRGGKDYRGEVPRAAEVGGGARGSAGAVGRNPALDRVAFGDWDAPEGRHRGRGPKNYARSDERIREDVGDQLSDDSWLDASDIEVKVAEGEVTLDGTVEARDDKHRAERLVERVRGVRHVQNNLRVRPQEAPPATTAETAGRTGLG
jgi:osmotically-inducible protein OsmY